MIKTSTLITMPVPSKDLIITFGSRTHDIAADTLLTSLFTTTTLIQEINKELAPEKRIEVKIKALQRGSFEVVSSIQEIVSQHPSLFGPGTIAYLSGLITIVVGVLQLRQFLKGEEPRTKQEIDTGIKIENVDGDVLVFDQKVVNIALGNQTVSDLVSKQFEKLNQDDQVQSYSVTTSAEEEPAFRADRNDFSYLQKKQVVAQDHVKEVVKNGVHLKIFKLSFDGGYKWGFVFDGNKITANIKDPEFFEAIDGGEKFAKGDELVVDLKVYQEYDQSIDGFVNQDYEIEKVIQHIPRNEQLLLID